MCNDIPDNSQQRISNLSLINGEKKIHHCQPTSKLNNAKNITCTGCPKNIGLGFQYLAQPTMNQVHKTDFK